MDDRTQLAGMILAGIWSNPEHYQRSINAWKERLVAATVEADALLAELAKTAKPEPPPTIEEVTEGRTVTVYPCPRCGETDPEAKSKTPPHRWLDKLRDAEDRANKFQASYDHLNKAWNYNVNKWSKIIDSRYCYDEPEVILDIDRALEQSVKDAARIKELEAENKHLTSAIADTGHAFGELVAARQRIAELEAALQTARMEGYRSALNDRTGGEAESVLQTARAEGAREKQERLGQWLRHAKDCMYAHAFKPCCTCGLYEALEIKP